MPTRRTPPRLLVTGALPAQHATSELTVYLLHAENPIGRVRHYLGITQTTRLARRMREHAHRRGAALTAALAARNDHLDLVHVWQPASYDLERQLKRRGRYARTCPICQTGDPERAILRVPCPDLPDIEASPLAVAFRSGFSR